MRKNLGKVDHELLALVDERAAELGQTRRTFTERALRAALRDDSLVRTAFRPQGSRAPKSSSGAGESVSERADVFRRATQRR